MHDIEQKNIEISAFMGLANPRLADWHVSPINRGVCYGRELAYHRDWNWLISVVEKIESMTTTDAFGKVNYIVTIEAKYCGISKSGETICDELQETRSSKMEVVYNTVIEFISWYNQQNK